MGWIGKLLGGGIGFVLGGPIGAVAGAVFGHAAFDSEEAERQGPRRVEAGPGFGRHQTAEFTFFVGAFSMIGKIVAVDGHISQNEVATVERFMREDLHLDVQSQQVAINIFQTATRSGQRFEDFATQFYGQFQFQPQILELMIDVLFRVSVADGTLNPVEEQMIRSAARIFRFTEEHYQAVKNRHAPQADKYYAVLGCAPTDPPETIRSQYRKLVKEYHPDHIAGKGLPEEFTKFAADKFREIQEAYEAIKKERNL